MRECSHYGSFGHVHNGPSYDRQPCACGQTFRSSKLNPINVRLIAFAIAGDRMCHHKHDDHPCSSCTINLAIPVELTGFYDVGSDNRICRVEVCVPGGKIIWVNPSQLCDDYDPMPIGYWHLRRALLTLWITGTNRHRDYRGARALSQYERQCAQDGGL